MIDPSDEQIRKAFEAIAEYTKKAQAFTDQIGETYGEAVQTTQDRLGQILPLFTAAYEAIDDYAKHRGFEGFDDFVNVLDRVGHGSPEFQAWQASKGDKAALLAIADQATRDRRSVIDGGEE